MTTTTTSASAVKSNANLCEELCPFWAELTPTEQRYVIDDMAMAIADGLDAAEYWDSPMSKDGHMATVIETRKAKGLPIDAPAPEPEQLGKRVAKVREMCLRYYGRGEQSYRDNLLDAGRKAHEYVTLRIGDGATREAAIMDLAGDMARLSGRKVDVNALIRASFAVDLLADGVDYGHVPYRTISALGGLVDRNAKDNTYGILGDADKAKSIFRQVCEKRVDRDGTRELVRMHADPDYVPKAQRETESDAEAEAEAVPDAKAEAAPVPCAQPTNLINPEAIAAKATVKDWAEQIHGFILDHDNPVDVIEALVSVWEHDKELPANVRLLANRFALGLRKSETPAA